jgi:hypothetical protein
LIGAGWRVEAHALALPPFDPEQFQLKLELFVDTIEALPAEHKFEFGGTDVEPFVDDPH